MTFTTTPKRTRKSVVLAGIQAQPNTAANLDGKAAMNVKNISAKPLSTETVALDFIRPWLGNTPTLITSFHVELDFEVALAGSGTPGKAPPWDPLIRACAFAATVTEDTSVVYTPISDEPERITLVYFLDGVLQTIVNAVGSVSFGLSTGGVPTLKFHFVGDYVPLVDADVPANVDYSAFITPQAIGDDYTPEWHIDGVTGNLSAFSLDVGNQIVYRNLVGGKGAIITDRKAAGSATFDLTSVATKNWWDVVLKGSLVPLSFTHGTVAGNIIRLASPSVQLSEPQYGDDNGNAQLQATLTLVPQAGNDELVITLT
ncbi:conserved hypothetical protein [Paraburkholderia tropica]